VFFSFKYYFQNKKVQTNGKYKESLDKSNKLLAYVNPLNKKQLSGKEDIIANIHSTIGNAHLELGQYDLALQAHEKDLEMSKELENKEGISRAYENIGRVYARNGKYSEAIEVWEKKLPLAETDMEKAWLYHEIGRCQLELGEYETSKDYGKKSLSCAEAIDDEVWQLNATVLIAQSDVKIGTLSSLNAAVTNFEKALKMTEKQSKLERLSLRLFIDVTGWGIRICEFWT
jgi:tetratricopeptide (TPR) repeat protein